MSDSVRDTVSQILPQDSNWRSKAHTRLEQLTMPHWALGRLMDLAEELAAMTRSMNPPVSRKTIVTMAGDHGVVEEGVSKYPQVVTGQMIHNFVNGGAGINACAHVIGAKVIVVDMGAVADTTTLAAQRKIISKKIAHGTKNIARGPAMTRPEAIRVLESGIQVAREFADSTDIFGTGDMGIGNTTPSAAIAAVITQRPVSEVTGRGTGIEDAQLRHKVAVIERALEINKPNPKDGIDVLARVGGFEIGGIAGLILGAASLRKPVLIDGFISTAAALIADTISPVSRDYMIAAHLSKEPGHAAMLAHISKEPLLDLDLRLGEGTGAALAMHLLDSAVAILTRVSTFDEAAVSKADK